MSTRYFAMIYGIVFLVIGIAGFIPGLKTPPEVMVDLTVDTGFGRLLGIFPVNVLHNIVHVLFGIWGVAAYRSFSGARLYARAVTVVYAVLAILGFFPVVNTLFGLVPLYGNDIWLHAALAVIAAYFGFFAPAPAERHATGHRTA
jgi:hypothetical protein